MAVRPDFLAHLHRVSCLLHAAQPCHLTWAICHALCHPLFSLFLAICHGQLLPTT